MAVPLDDFDIIFENEFLLVAKVTMTPHLGGLMIYDANCLSFVAGIYSEELRQ